MSEKPPVVVIGEDDDDEFLLIERALGECGVPAEVIRVRDGEELFQVIRPRRAARERIVVLLDLNMPRVDGREALQRMRAEEALRTIPVVILSGSGSPTDIAAAYDSGANSFLRKPLEFGKLVDMMKVFGEYWLTSAELP